jgi:hypothetical protein
VATSLPGAPPGAATLIDSIPTAEGLADMAAANANAPIEAKQEVLATAAIDARLALAIALLRSERDGLLRSRPVPDPAQLALARDPRKVLSHLRDLTIATIESSRSSFAFGGIEVVTESVIRQAEGIPHRSAAELPMRTDVAILVGPQRSLSPIAVLSPPFAHEPLRLMTDEKLPVAVGDLAWDACRVRARGPRDPLQRETADWFWRWFDAKDTKAPDEKGFRDVIHALSFGAYQDGTLTFDVDFGSAPVDALDDLLRSLRRASASSVELSLAPAPPGAPGR